MDESEKDDIFKKAKEEAKVNLDKIIKEEIGEFGRYQKMALALCLIVALLSGYSGNECLIPECETGDFSPSWLSLAIPSAGGTFDNCRRFNSSGVSCSADNFDRDDVVRCEVEYVYEKTDTVVYEFNLACQEWRRSLIGSVFTFGKMLALPLTGIIADRYGRRTALALNAFNCAWIGTARSFTQSYGSFIALEYLEAAFGAAAFSCGYTIVMEFMGPKYRVAAGATMSTFYATGLIMQALMAWAVPYWRHLTLALFIPQLVTVIYFWIMPESVRWYLSKGRYNEAESQLKRAAKMNGKLLSEASLAKLKESSEEERKITELKKEHKIKDPWLVTLVFQHKPILLRCIITPVWWITTTLVYYIVLLIVFDDGVPR
ncbi:solute carrier family 22 member 1-like [Cydia fagiglandana]|uniref:solute carrier family 22 member 1-like n=1 Tax=Cydia fagiglandana TaxID=1458189 RepID=UPI002FEE52A7